MVHRQHYYKDTPVAYSLDGRDARRAMDNIPRLAEHWNVFQEVDPVDEKCGESSVDPPKK